MITVGPMQLNQPQAADPMEPFFLGTQSGGGYWTDISRLSSHDHSGGLLGAAVAVNIPDGSITAADLDPSVLLPYALVDGSKPFTGQVTMEADAVVRDALSFGQQGTALAPDAGLTRTAPGTLQVASSLLAPTGAALTLKTGTGAGTVRASLAQTGTLTLSPDATVLGVDISGTGKQLRLTYPAVASNNLRTGVSGELIIDTSGTDRLRIAQNGTVTLSPDAGGVSLIGTDLYLQSSTGPLKVYANSVGLVPYATNFNSCGGPGALWTAVYATAGTINTSTVDAKTDITPLDPAACYQAAKDVVWYDFRYAPPAYRAPEPPADLADDAADDNATKAEKKAARDAAEASAKDAYARMLVETAPARNQRGFVYPTGDAKDEAGGTLPPVPDLFGLSDRESTTPQADLATLGCALQEVIRRLEQLEAPAA